MKQTLVDGPFGDVDELLLLGITRADDALAVDLAQVAQLGVRDQAFARLLCGVEGMRDDRRTPLFGGGTCRPGGSRYGLR